MCIINESKLHLSCSLADLVTVRHLHCVALLCGENLSTCKRQETQSGQLEQLQSKFIKTETKQNAPLKKIVFFSRALNYRLLIRRESQ